MKIALAQMKVIPGRPKVNLRTMLSMIDQAKKKKVDLVIFPEMAVGGYLVGDKWIDDKFCKNLMEHNNKLQEASKGIAVAYGNIFVDEKINERVKDRKLHPNKDGRARKYNAIYVFQNGKPAKKMEETSLLPEGIQPKTLLPNYRFFDDERYFFSTEDMAKDFNVLLEDLLSPFIIEVNGMKVPIGFELCEDLWCEDYRRNGSPVNITKILIDKGAERIVNLSASPWTFGKNSARDRRIKFLKKESGSDFVPFYYVNCTGVQNNGKNIITFDGGSTVYNSDGNIVFLSKAPFKEELIFTNNEELVGKPIERIEKSRIAQKYESIIQGLRNIKDIAGSEVDPRFVIGLSGGIDSAVVASLLAQAVGSKKIIGVNMPSKYNSEKTKDAAAYLAEKLGIDYQVVPIEELTSLNQSIFESGKNDKLSVAVMENVQAKIRGTSILSNLAAKHGALFTSNGNKLEVALGYATLYGDWGGAIAPIADLTKTEVVEMAKYLNREKFKEEVIPASLLPDKLWRFRKDQIEPTAELKEAQVDPMKFGYHCALLEAFTDYRKKSVEDIMEWYLKGTLDKNLGVESKLITRWGLENPKEFIRDLEWFDKTLQRNVFKRVQSPPIIITSKSAYGFDIRESMLSYETSQEFQSLKEKILKMKEYKFGGNK